MSMRAKDSSIGQPALTDWTRRAFACVLIAAHVATAVPAMAVSPSIDDATPPPDPPKVQVNRQRPVVSAPPDHPVFSARPTSAEIRRARVFGEALVPVGRTPTEAENAELAQAIQSYSARGRVSDTHELTAFIAKHGDSPWTPSLLANLASIQRMGGFFSQAIDTGTWAWQLARDAEDPQALAVGDYAIGEAVDLATTLGQQGLLDSLLRQIGNRTIGGSAGAKVDRGRHTLDQLRSHPDEVISSGAWAVQQLALASSSGEGIVPDVLRNYPARARGMTMMEVQALAKQVGISLVAASRTPTTAPIVPSIIHFKFGHFTALLAVDGDRYLVRDPAFGSVRWLSRAALDADTSDAALIPKGALPRGWTPAPTAATQLIGHSCTQGSPAAEPPCGGSSGSGGNSGCATCPRGMVTASLNPLAASLLLADTPVGYGPPRGPSIYFTLSYNQRDIFQPSVFAYGNVGPLWTHNWTAYVEEEPAWCSSTTCTGEWIRVFLPGGGHDTLEGAPVNGVYPTSWRSKAQLVRTSTSPIRFERRLPDGSIEVYAQSDGGPVGHRRIFLTELIDSQGQSATLSYDAQLRLVAIADALGQVTTLGYELPSDALKLTSITDPFGRRASLTYTAAGQLASITDVLGLTSTMTYDAGDFVAGLTTPYGTSTFRHEGPANHPWFPYIETTDPLGGTERAEYRWASTDLSATVTSVPTGFESENQSLDHYSSVVWDKRGWALGPRDVAYATVTRWMLAHTIDYGAPPAVPVPQSIQRPLEGRVWYQYPGQTSTFGGLLGSLNRPSVIGQVLDDGTSQIRQVTYNSQGLVTSETDPLGRRTSYAYAANGIDLVEVRQTTGALNDLLASYTNYNSQHLPGSVTDAAGQATSFTYNTAGQVLTSTNAKNETTTWAYGTTGYLQSVTGPVSGATTSYTYDDLGRIRTVTDSDGYTLTADYDVFDRPTRTTYPDGTYAQTTYDRLDATVFRDRLGRLTRTFYDALRRVAAVTDALGRTITQQWCVCGSLDGFIDAQGNTTRWERDRRGRVTREVRADGMTATAYTYQSASGRLATVTDPKGQVTTYNYNLDDTPEAVSFTNTTIATPTVSYTYDSNYPRLATMVDGTGTTSYEYKAPGTLGAGQLASVDGPLSDDTISYTYDELRRVIGRAINGADITRVYDALSRLTSETNSLGTFTYTYDGTASRLATVTYPNNQTSIYTYLSNTQDRRLQTIEHKYPGGATLSKFDYTYDAVGRVLTWQQQTDNAQPAQWTYEYDTVDQLRRAVQRTTGAPPTILHRYAYDYDRAGNRLTEQVDDAVTGWTYDTLNRLVAQSSTGMLQVAGTVSEPATVTVNGREAAVDPEGYFTAPAPVTAATNTLTVTATDPSGNSSTKAYTIDQTSGTKSFTFDSNGNLTSDGVRTFEWNGRNELTSLVSGDHRTEYSYDGFGRRTTVVEKTNGVLQSTTSLVWCLDTLCEERGSDGAVARQFGYGEQVQSALHFFARDHLQSVTDVTASSGTRLSHQDYTPWGQRSGSAVSSVGFASYQQDAGNSLLFAVYRAYDPDLGRWLNEDPIGLSGGLDLYAYVHNNPIDARDPLGLYCIYSQSTGRMTCYAMCPTKEPSCPRACTPSAAPGSYYDRTGYSGKKGPDRNNPDAQSHEESGPVPRGPWKIGPPHYRPKTGPNTMNLKPLFWNECWSTTRDCSSFRIHGDKLPERDASTGCIILPPNRVAIPANDIVYVCR